MPRIKVKTQPGADTIPRATTPGTRIIPRGPGSYSQALGRVIPSHQIKKLRKEVLARAPEYLNLELSVRQQDREWETFIHAMTTAFPVFKRFKHSWPLRDFMSQYLGNHRLWLQRKDAAAATKENGKGLENTVDTTTASTNVSRQPLQSTNTIDQPPKDQQLPQDTSRHTATPSIIPRKSLPPARQVYVLVPPKAPADATSSQVSSASTSTLVNSSQVSATLSGSGSGSGQLSISSISSQALTTTSSSAPEPIKAFLASLSPPLPQLGLTFVGIGIINAEYIRAMAAWPASQRHDFLEMLVLSREITRFEMQVVAQGLREMVGLADSD
ncbi:hypothetical protein NEOLEDRAFT_1173564 [Neolentinus lepideus HHB14362 ss-1]|uniref:Uncharacterized protein n=1 Tax=Neolentinus lepideus HHB14362 ss-1 TaxID=1314782 RepID=A0A165MLP6_9AGAM|nr:hypothetical protein NEOLEDRAFT_1173564 [Neolentinus lepideus HHB14362 ss-1]